MSYPLDQQRIVDRFKPTWCFTHGGAVPCEACQRIQAAYQLERAQVEAEHPFVGRCFDCKVEFAPEGESDVRLCGCGEMLRNKRYHKYP